MLKGEIRWQGLARPVLSPYKWSLRVDGVQAPRNPDGTLPFASRSPPYVKRERTTSYVDGQLK